MDKRVYTRHTLEEQLSAVEKKMERMTQQIKRKRSILETLGDKAQRLRNRVPFTPTNKREGQPDATAQG